MSMADEIEKLQKLKEAGTLSDQEFREAKRLLLQNPRPEASLGGASRGGDLVGLAANRYVSFHIKMAYVGVVFAVIFLILFIYVVATQGGNRIARGPSAEVQRILNQSQNK